MPVHAVIVIGVHVAVIGMGLIGGSLMRAIAHAGHRVAGYDLDPKTRAMAREGASRRPGDAQWRVADSVADAVSDAEVVVVATPLTAAGPVLDQLAATGWSGLLTDVVSVKVPMRELAVRRLPPGVRYVGGHPMAGKETAGYAASDPALFVGCAWVLCLDEGTDVDEWLRLARIVTELGARVVPATADRHDRVVAAVSHAPHLLAVALAGAVDDPLAATLAAGSFRDGTRVAASPPELIAAMCGGNAGPLIDALDAVLAHLSEARAALASPEPIAAMRSWATPGHTARTRWPRHVGEPRSVPATAERLLALGEEGGFVAAVSDDGRTVTAVTPQ